MTTSWRCGRTAEAAAALKRQNRLEPPWHFAPPPAEVNGIRSMDLSAWGVPPGLDAGLCMAKWRCRVEADFYGESGLLGGMFRLGTAYDDIFMMSDASFTWAGYLDSDGPYVTGGEGARPTFTGQWRLVGTVPEPGTLALLCLPLAWVAVRRQVRWARSRA